MRLQVTVVDYGVGNLFSVTRALEYCGADVKLANSPTEILNAERLLLPGVGAFADGISELQHLNLVEAIFNYTLSHRPLLGICLGMQLLMDGSDEFGSHKGLGFIPGWVKKLPAHQGVKLPHIGWNSLQPCDSTQGLKVESLFYPDNDVYFVHSYYVEPKKTEHIIAKTSYGNFKFCSVIKKDNIIGYQFHPEKSGKVGLQLLKNFLAI